MKTNKSYTKRIKLTKNGKLKVRAKGQNHFNAKESGNTTRSKRGTKNDFNMSNKHIARFM
ncbi:MAG: 50S ribosomal protein L35 [Candidatus Pacebacteria bacterium]|nr:50S ribosomal protein L35 [Candidatus Paceibacterota bacterium]